jgi:hypothetical protein
VALVVDVVVVGVTLGSGAQFCGKLGLKLLQVV